MLYTYINMNLNKILNIGLVVIPASLVGGVLAIASVTTISIINHPQAEQGLYPYNELVTDFSKSSDIIDKKALNTYQERTVSLQYTLNGTLWHFGTAWYWGEKNSTHSYYATNLHVVDSLLVYDRSLSPDYDKQFKFNPQINSLTDPIQYPEFKLHYQLYDEKPLDATHTFKDVTLEKVNVMNSNSVPQFNVVDKHLYSDLVVFSARTISPGLQAWDFIDTLDEIDNVITNIKNLTFYIAGFPYYNGDDGPTWTTGKYKWKADNSMQGYKNPPGWNTAAQIFASQTNDYFNSSFGLDVRASGLNNFAEKHHYSYTRQVILPGLNFEGGSSGSLVTVLNERTGELQPLGIYWGVYQGYVSNDKENMIYQGGLDLFFSGVYKLQSSSLPYAYDNIKFWIN